MTDGDAGTSRVEQADGFIGELPSGKVPLRKPYGLNHGLIQHTHTVMFFERPDQAPHHLDGRQLVRLFDFDHLEATGQSRVFLEILLVLGPGRRGDRPQFASSQCGLEQVRGVPLPGGPSGPDHRVGLVDKQNDRTGRCLDLVDHRLQTVFKFALHPRPGLQQPQVQRP